MTAVIYARYSSDNQREESIEGQIRECTAYAEKNGITVIKHYIDRALSAKTDNRPDFQQMIKDSENGMPPVRVIWRRYISIAVAIGMPSCFNTSSACCLTVGFTRRLRVIVFSMVITSILL